MKKILYRAVFLFIFSLVFYPMPDGITATFAGKMIPLVLEGNIHLQLPSTMQLTENPVQDREQLQYSAYLNDEHSSLHGYIQIWELKDLHRYLRESKAISTYDFYSYTLNNFQRNNYKGVINIWGASFGESLVSGKEYWIELSSSKVLRLAFLTGQKNFHEEQLKIISSIISSLK